MLQRRLRWFGHTARRSSDDLLHEALHLNPKSILAQKTRGQLKTWVTTIKQDLVLITGPQVHGLRAWNRSWLQFSVDLAQNRSTWATAVRDAVNSREEASSIRPG